MKPIYSHGFSAHCWQAQYISNSSLRRFTSNAADAVCPSFRFHRDEQLGPVLPTYFPTTFSHVKLHTSRIRAFGTLSTYYSAHQYGYRHPLDHDPSHSISGKVEPDAKIKLDLPALDNKWQRKWQEQENVTGSRRTSNVLHHIEKPKSYILPMFPYPSGNLHMGHLRVYTIADVLSRWKRMTGFTVLNPMGWDSFGLPAENAAIERGVHPAVWTHRNIEKMRDLLKAMNTSIQWEHEISTCDPKFYKHTQKLFLLLKENGLAYQAEGLVNWDPVDQTVLANEQVDKEGNSWRSGAKVEHKMLKQWYLKVTDFQKPLLADLDVLTRDRRWPERVVSMQKNWIGLSKGANLTFKVKTKAGSLTSTKKVEVFTTRPDTIFGAQFVALSLSHPIVREEAHFNEGLRIFIEKTKSQPNDTKGGYLLRDVFAENPSCFLEGAPEEAKTSLPVYAAPYVLEGYGEGAVMGVPGHDERDFAFWKANCPEVPVRYVIEHREKEDIQCDRNQPLTKKGVLNSRCGNYGGMLSEQAGHRVVEDLVLLQLARHSETWRLRDWLISRQRYWGTPIPVVHCEACGPVSVPEDELPIKLPDLPGDWFKGKTGNPLEKADAWRKVPCPNCARPAERDTDTMDTFVDSSWYFMRFPDAHNEVDLFSQKCANSMLPVDIYVGGIEHAILHLLYARFVSKFLVTIGKWPKGGNIEILGEPFQKLISQGMVHGKTFTDPSTGKFLRPEEVEITSDGPQIKGTSEAPDVSFQKMSKSKHNGIDPTACIAMYGADVVRAHVLFAAPVIDVLEWDETKIAGCQRWLGKVWQLVRQFAVRIREKSAEELSGIYDAPDDPSKWDEFEARSWVGVQDNLRNIHRAYETASLNTLVSDLMKMTNHIAHGRTMSFGMHYRQISTLIRALAPVAPAFAEECWKEIHYSRPTCDSKMEPVSWSIFDEPFPRVDQHVVLKDDVQTCAVQENGKLRFTVKLPVLDTSAHDDSDALILDRLGETEAGQKWFQRRARDSWKKVVVIRRGKTINFVG